MTLAKTRRPFSGCLSFFVLLLMSLAMGGCGDDGVDTEPQVLGDPSTVADSDAPSDSDSLPLDPAEDSADPSREPDTETGEDAGAEDTETGEDAGAEDTETGEDAGADDTGSEVDVVAPGEDSDAGVEEGDSSLPDIPDGGDGTPAMPLRIVPIGDSITQGRVGDGSFDSPDGSTLSYRYALFQLFVDAGIEVDFVGSHTGGFGGDPAWEDYRAVPFDRDHEGHWGWRLDGIRDSLEVWLEGYEADVALIMLGTNDVSAGDGVSQMVLEAADIISILRQANPDMLIIWGHAYQEWDPFPEFREAMEVLATEWSTPRSPIVTVNHAEGWVSDPSNPASHTVDWVHPNLSGDQKLAEGFFEALQDWL